MGEIVGVGLISHAPTVMLPREVCYQLNDGKEISLVPGLRRLRTGVLDALAADTIVIFDTHWHTTVEHVFSSHERRSGKYTSEELPRGISQLPYDYRGDPELAETAAKAVTRLGVQGTPISDPYLPVHYGTINLVHYLCRSERAVSVSMVQTGETDDFLQLGAAVGEAVAAIDRRVVVLASGGMTHRFWPLRQLVDHEASDPVHIFTPQARAADEERLKWMAAGDHARIIRTMPKYLPHRRNGRLPALGESPGQSGGFTGPAGGGAGIRGYDPPLLATSANWSITRPPIRFTFSRLRLGRPTRSAWHGWLPGIMLGSSGPCPITCLMNPRRGSVITWPWWPR